MPCMERSSHQDQNPSNSTISRVTSLQFMELLLQNCGSNSPKNVYNDDIMKRQNI